MLICKTNKPLIVSKNMSLLIHYTTYQCLSGEDCQTESGQKCIFPFNYEGTTYHKCTSVDNDQPWCAYEVDSEGTLVDDEWENCDNTCYLGKHTKFVYDIEEGYYHQ